MPLKSGKSKKVFTENIKELWADNMKKGKEKGQGGKIRTKEQILAIAYSKKKKRSNKK